MILRLNIENQEMEFNIPIWAQQITIFGVTICSVILGIWKYIKTESDKIRDKSKDNDTNVIASASFIDTKLLRELIDTLREHSEEMGRQSQRITRSQGDLRETLIEGIEIMHVNTNALANMTRFLTKQTNNH